jgi:REP element-mobilizing transposase RayT
MNIHHFTVVCEKRSEMLHFVNFVVTFGAISVYDKCNSLFISCFSTHSTKVCTLVIMKSVSYIESDETVASLLS